MAQENHESLELLLEKNENSGISNRKVLQALNRRDFDCFKRILSPAVANSYYEEHKKTLLDLACSQQGTVEFVNELLKNGANPNRFNQTHRNYPIFFAIEIGSVEVVRAIVKSPKFDIDNLASCQTTAVQYAVIVIKNKKQKDYRKYKEILKFLLEENADVNIPGNGGITPIFRAAFHYMEDVVETIVEYSKNLIDLDTYTDKHGRNARHIIEKNLPDLFVKLPVERFARKTQIDSYVLLMDLYKMDERKFLEDLEKVKQDERLLREVLNFIKGSFTLLQLACSKIFPKVVSRLLKEGADPSLIAANSTYTALSFVCRKGYHEILQCFVDTGRKDLFEDVDLLQSTIDAKRMSVSKRANHKKCVEILLKLPEIMKNVDKQNEFGNTVLHYATMYGDDDSSLELLRAGAYVGFNNDVSESCLQFLSTEVLKKFFDECVTTNDRHPNECSHRIYFDYRFLIPPDKDSDKDFNMDILQSITQLSSTKTLLKHPLLASFITIKWETVKRLVALNAITYLIFCISLITYILSDVYQNIPVSKVFRIITAIFLIILCFREIMQMFLFKWKYWHSFGNYLDIAIIVLATMSLVLDIHDIYAVAIFFSSIEILFALEKSTTNTVHFHMFKTVLWTYSRIALGFYFLILAFSLSFYLLFKNSSDEAFQNPGKAIFKTLVMMTGEFDLSNIDFATFPGISHLLFLSFLFMVPVVLFNLLTGLAVSDIQAIKNDAEILVLMRMVQVISHTENILRSFGLYNFMRRVYQRFIFTKSPDNSVVYVEVNNSLDIILQYNDTSLKVKIDQYTIDQAKNIISDRQNNSPLDELRLKIDEIMNMLNKN